MPRSSPKTLDAASVRERHRGLVIRLLWQEGRISRAEIARRTGLSRSTVSAITGELLRTDLVRELGAGTSRGGRRPIVLGFDHDARLVVGVDVGASHLAVALVNLSGQVRAWRSQPHPVRDDPEGTIALARRLARDVLDEEPGAARRAIGVGLSVPSPVVEGEPNRLSSRLLPRWEGHDLIGALEQCLGLPVIIDNDANAGALAELRWGAARERSDVAFIKIATGIGVGFIVNGALYRGASGVAGEISHMSIDADGPRCVCGQRGCLALFGSAQAITRRAEERLAEGGHSVLRAGAVTTDGIVDAALAGDRLAIEVIQEAGQRIGIGVANLINIIDPGLVVLGGELTRAGRILVDPIDEAVRSRVLSIAAVPAQIITTQLGERGVALGAATQVIDHALQHEALLLGQQQAAAGG